MISLKSFLPFYRTYKHSLSFLLSNINISNIIARSMNSENVRRWQSPRYAFRQINANEKRIRNKLQLCINIRDYSLWRYRRELKSGIYLFVKYILLAYWLNCFWKVAKNNFHFHSMEKSMQWYVYILTQFPEIFEVKTTEIRAKRRFKFNVETPWNFINVHKYKRTVIYSGIPRRYRCLSNFS